MYFLVNQRSSSAFTSLKIASFFQWKTIFFVKFSGCTPNMVMNTQKIHFYRCRKTFFWQKNVRIKFHLSWMLFRRSYICLLFGWIFSGSEFMCRRHSAVIHCRNGHFSKHPDIEATKNELSKEWKLTKEIFPTKRESREKTVWMLQIQQRPKKHRNFLRHRRWPK